MGFVTDRGQKTKSMSMCFGGRVPSPCVLCLLDCPIPTGPGSVDDGPSGPSARDFGSNL